VTVGGDTITVSAHAFVTPHGARPLSELRYPPVPADALKSRLSSGVIECHVAVGLDGQVAADCGNNPPDIPRFLLVRAKEILERAHWQPAMNDQGERYFELVTVQFRWH
jgi:hypothetical protein